MKHGCCVTVLQLCSPLLKVLCLDHHQSTRGNAPSAQCSIHAEDLYTRKKGHAHALDNIEGSKLSDALLGATK